MDAVFNFALQAPGSS